jgi:hypothetical protein
LFGVLRHRKIPGFKLFQNLIKRVFLDSLQVKNTLATNVCTQISLDRLFIAQKESQQKSIKEGATGECSCYRALKMTGKFNISPLSVFLKILAFYLENPQKDA